MIKETNSNNNELTENLIETTENDLYNLSQSGNSERSFINFGNALKGAVDIMTRHINEMEKLPVYQQDSKI